MRVPLTHQHGPRAGRGHALSERPQKPSNDRSLIHLPLPKRQTVADFVALVVLTISAALSTASLGQDEGLDPPSRVARISDVAGDLFLATPDHAGEWASIGLNYPVTAGDNLWISANGRAEVDFGNGRLRLAGDTNLQVAALDETSLALFVATGRVIVRMRSLAPGEMTHVETPHTQIDIVRPGVYRIDVDSAVYRTTLSVREGEAAIRFADGVQQVLSGQVATISGIDGAGLAVENGYSSDGFDAWSMVREYRYDSARVTAYVSTDMVGARDLDDYGTWETTQTYGPVWYPSTVAVGWAPYRYGTWTWLAPYGWTWVDSAPWGYAPFHYGRWIYASGRWGWCPGERTGRPRWSPALVAWYRGSGWGAESNVYGWIPLGWGDPYVPPWRLCSGRCWRQYNQPFAVAQRDVQATSLRYANALVPGAMTAVPASVLSASRAVAANQVPVGPATASSAAMLAGAPAFAPAAARNPVRPGLAVPIPAGAQFQQLTRSAQYPPPRAMPSTATSVPTGSAASSLTYGGVPGGRGAYTGIAPTPGPKAPAPAEHALAPQRPVMTYAPPTPQLPVVAPPSLGRAVSPSQAPPAVAAPVATSRAVPLQAPAAATPTGAGMPLGR